MLKIEICIHFQVIDEILHVLSTISHLKVKSSSSIFILSERPLRTHEVLQELRDISSMAIDHFEEKIAPSLKKAYCELPTRSLLTCTQYQCMCLFVFCIHIYLVNYSMKSFFLLYRFSGCVHQFTLFINSIALFTNAVLFIINSSTKTDNSTAIRRIPNQFHMDGT